MRWYDVRWALLVVLVTWDGIRCNFFELPGIRYDEIICWHIFPHKAPTHPENMLAGSQHESSPLYIKKKKTFHVPYSALSSSHLYRSVADFQSNCGRVTRGGTFQQGAPLSTDNKFKWNKLRSDMLNFISVIFWGFGMVLVLCVIVFQLCFPFFYFKFDCLGYGCWCLVCDCFCLLFFFVIGLSLLLLLVLVMVFLCVCVQVIKLKWIKI